MGRWISIKNPKLMKAQKCILIFHGTCREIDMGEFPSKSAAKKYVSECWNRPYTIKPTTKKTDVKIAN